MSTFEATPLPPRDEPPLTSSASRREIEEQLRRSEERYRSLVAATTQIVWVANARGLVEEDSPSWRAYTGQSFAEMRGWGWLMAIHPDDRPGTAHVWSQAAASGTFYEIEYRLRRYDGVYRTFWARGVPVREPDGRIREWIGTCTDITERKRLDDELIQTAYEATLRANQLEATFEALTDAVFIYDRDGRILGLNAAARRFLGYLSAFAPPEQELTIHDYLARLAPRDTEGQPLPRERWPSLRLLRGEELSDGPLSDLLLRMPNGCEHRVSMSGSPVRNERGEIIGAVAIGRDVTARYQLERRTHEALAALLAMAEALVAIPRDLATPEPALAVASPNLHHTQRQTHEITHRLALLICQVLSCRRVTLLVVDPEEETLHMLARSAAAGAAEESALEAAPPGLPLRSCLPAAVLMALRCDQLVGEQADGDFVQAPEGGGSYRAILAPMLIDQQLIGLLRIEYGEGDHEYGAQEAALIKAVARLAALVTEHERLLHERAEARANELALRESNRRMDEFLSIASHELRTPLTTIKGNVQLARRHLARLQVAEPEQQARLAMIQELLERTDRQTGLLTRLVRDLLESSRAQANRLALQLRPQNLVAIVRQTVEDLRSTAPQRTLRLFIAGEEQATSTAGGLMDALDPPGPDPAPIPVLADAEGIGLVLTNYLTNAFKYSPREAPVEVSVEMAGDCARVAVRDQGPGLPLEEQARIWERFYRVPGIEAQGNAAPGLGLGLHICKMIIQQHGGQVGVTSRPGAGATFWFTLPRLSPAIAGIP
jgi:PAS domain S-box-containing protein